MATCNIRDDWAYFSQFNMSLPGQDSYGSPSPYFMDGNTSVSEPFMQMAEVFCTEQENYCTIEDCRCADQSWLRNELQTTTGQPCFACSPPPKPRCTYLRDYCTAEPCECGFGHTMLQVFERDGVSPCFQCQVPLPPHARNSEVPMFKATMLFVFVVLVGLAVGCFVGWLWEPATGTESKCRKGGAKQRPRSWSERWAFYLAGICESVSRALIEKSATVHRGSRPLQRHISYVLKFVLQWCGVAFGKLSGAAARLKKPERPEPQMDAPVAKSTVHAKPADKPKVVQDEQDCPKRETHIRTQRPPIVASTAEPTLVQTRLLKKLQKRKELRQTPVAKKDPEPTMFVDESWIDDLERKEEKKRNAALKKAAKASQRKQRSCSKGDLEATNMAEQDASDITDNVSQVLDTEQPEMQSTAPMEVIVSDSPRAHLQGEEATFLESVVHSLPTLPVEPPHGVQLSKQLQDEQESTDTSSDHAAQVSEQLQDEHAAHDCESQESTDTSSDDVERSHPQVLKGKLSAEIANGRLAMMTIVGIRTSKSWVDRVRHTGLPLRAFKSALGVQGSGRFWDPAGFAAAGIAQQVFSSDIDVYDLVLDASGAPEARHPPKAPPRDLGTEADDALEDGIVFGSLNESECRPRKKVMIDEPMIDASKKDFVAQEPSPESNRNPELTPEWAPSRDSGEFKACPLNDEAEPPRMRPFASTPMSKWQVWDGEERVFMFRTFIHIEEPPTDTRACRRSRSV